MKELIRKVFLHSVKKYILLFFISLGLVLLGLSLNGFDVPIYYVNSFFFAGFAMVCIGGLSIINYFGGYDFMSYAFSKRNPDGTRVEYSAYISNKIEKRKTKTLPFGPYFVIGALFTLVSFLIYVIIY